MINSQRSISFVCSFRNNLKNIHTKHNFLHILQHLVSEYTEFVHENVKNNYSLFSEKPEIEINMTRSRYKTVKI